VNQSSNNTSRHRGHSTKPNKQDIRSEAEISKYNKHKDRMSEKNKLVNGYNNLGMSSAIQQTIIQSRYEKDKFLLALYELNGAYDSMRKLIMTPLSKS